MADRTSYEAPQVVVVGSIEELTKGLPVVGGLDVVLFYRQF